MGWLLVIIFMPLLGIPLYLTFGERKLKVSLNRKTKLKLHNVNESHLVKHPIHSLLVSLGIPPSCNNSQSEFHKDGKVAWQELKRILNKAQCQIDIAIFILADDQVGREVLSILSDKAAKGIKVRLLMDGVGSFSFSKKRFKPLKDNRGQIAWFIPVIHKPFRGRTNLRNHRKMVIVDQYHVWTGGRNISLDYLGQHCPKDCWVDLSFTQSGEIAINYLEIFEADWAFANHTKNGFSAEFFNKNKSGLVDAGTINQNDKSEIQIIPSGPDVQGDPIYSVMLTAFYTAKSRIIISTPYYVPDDNIQKALKLAALRGVEVDLIIPKKSNHKLADIARSRSLRELNIAGVTISYSLTMIHAKAIVIDSNFAMAGSANLDIRSLFLNCELMSAFYSEKDIKWLITWLKALQKTSSIYQPQTVTTLDEIKEGLALIVAYQL
jgi:cardiolipin synthase